MVLQEALRTRGLKDDTTCIVVDIIPPDNTIELPTPPKKQGKLKAFFYRRKSCDSAKLSKKLSAIGIVEELFEEGSAMLAERLACLSLLFFLLSIHGSLVFIDFFCFLVHYHYMIVLQTRK